MQDTPVCIQLKNIFHAACERISSTQVYFLGWHFGLLWTSRSRARFSRSVRSVALWREPSSDPELVSGAPGVFSFPVSSLESSSSCIWVVGVMGSSRLPASHYGWWWLLSPWVTVYLLLRLEPVVWLQAVPLCCWFVHLGRRRAAYGKTPSSISQ